jgi:xanthine dehydrogenase YagT iron-sulfur-binding subunit
MAGTELTISLVVNGARHELLLEPRVSLLDALRERLDVTGPKKGCNQGACGACTVLLDGERVNACLTLAVQAHGRQVTTVEGLASGDILHPLQAAFIERDGFQCGYCTPGQLCSAIGMLREFQRGVPSAVTPPRQSGPAEWSTEEIRERLSGNLCRCGAYNGIVQAVHQAFDAEVPR